MKLFVFGTLMSEMSANNLLSTSKLCCVGYVSGFDMYIAGFPRLRKNLTNGNKILGEVWDVPSGAVNSIDAYEGTPTLFKRVAIDLEEHKVQRSIIQALKDEPLFFYDYQWSKQAEEKYIESDQWEKVQPNFGGCVSFKHHIQNR
jgi:gamma-glutamylcyclotransferase (GGCT)/AIG2-like uncharacterized protein YtfP